jgi:P27 family predicted phage terminase small subunit
MGRPSKPTELKVLEGNRGKRALNKNEPDPDYLDNLEPAEWLPDDAKVVWRELAFKLRKAKVLTVLDVPAFEKACVAIAMYRRATRALIGADLIVSKDAGERERTKKPPRAIGFQAEMGPEKEPAPKADAEPLKPDAAPGNGSLNPWAIVQAMSFKQAMTVLREFGMTPAARTRVMIDPQLGLFGGGNGDEKASGYFT